jgi:hypothetical protein
VLLAGPLGRILASEWSWLRPRVTFLEMGSFWDVELWSRGNHHLGVYRPCSSANDIIGFPCTNSWIHSVVPTRVPEFITRDFLCFT